MRKKNRSFLLMSLLSASLLVSVFTIVQAQSPSAPAAKATNWSDPATWPNRKVPVAGGAWLAANRCRSTTLPVPVR